MEEFLKTINNDEENIIFVQSLSSLAKNTLFNQQKNKNRRKQQKQQVIGAQKVSTSIIRLENTASGQADEMKQKAVKKKTAAALDAFILELEKDHDTKKSVPKPPKSVPIEKKSAECLTEPRSNTAEQLKQVAICKVHILLK